MTRMPEMLEAGNQDSNSAVAPGSENCVSSRCNSTRKLYYWHEIVDYCKAKDARISQG